MLGLLVFQVLLIIVLISASVVFIDVYSMLFQGNLLLTAILSYLSLLLTIIIVPAVLHRIIRLFISSSGSNEAMGKREQILWGINSVIFDSSYWIISKMLPVGVFPHVIYRLYGLKCGKGVGIFARLLDVDLIEIGDHSVIGTNSLVTAHMILADGRFYRNKITIGHHSSIGMNSVVLPGVRIGDYCIVAPGSVVLKDSVLDSYSLYSGNPVEKVKDLRDRYDK
ncbi:MAG: acyltransferase [Candidatus Hodarchaeales archaeon]